MGFISSLPHITRVLLGLAVMLQYLCICVFGGDLAKTESRTSVPHCGDLICFSTSYFQSPTSQLSQLCASVHMKPSTGKAFLSSSKLHLVFRPHIKFHLLHKVFPGCPSKATTPLPSARSALVPHLLLGTEQVQPGTLPAGAQDCLSHQAAAIFLCLLLSPAQGLAGPWRASVETHS